MLTYKTTKFTWKYGGLIQQLLDEGDDVELCDIISNTNICDFIFANAFKLNCFSYKITGEIITTFEFLQVNFLHTLASHILLNTDIKNYTFPYLISCELIKYPRFYRILQHNKITCDGIRLYYEFWKFYDKLSDLEQTPTQCIKYLPYYEHITDKDLINCNYLEKLDKQYTTRLFNITTFHPFKDTLLELDVSYCCYDTYRGFKDDALSILTNLRRLNAENNPYITTCKPFAKTLINLNASYNCGISDEGLKYCTKLQFLAVYCNEKITTCKPFCKTLLELNACGQSGINDEGLNGCIILRKLDAGSNPKITTCKPFCKTLHTLNASGICGIDNKGLNGCIILEKLDVCNNNKITISIEEIPNL
jgi:hypothetical protein